MPVRKIVTYGHPVLEKLAEPVSQIDGKIIDLARDMILTMHAAPGIGLAAPQVNVSRRVITVDLSVGENPADLIIPVTPELLKTEGKEVSEEGCLSVPGIHENVRRPARVRIKGLDLEGKERVLDATGQLARVFCHEIDHINGRLFIKHLSPFKKARVKKKLKKTQESS